MIVQIVSTVERLHYAATLIKSLKKHNRSLDYSILVTDVSKNRLPQICDLFDEEKIELLCCEDLCVDYLDTMREYYSVLEFSDACKFLAIDFQFKNKNVTECLFLDSDIYALGKIENIFSECNSDILISPHTLSPCPLDGNAPDDIEIIMTGYINTGMMYFKNSKFSIEAINWLIETIKLSWFVAPTYGMYAGQQWVSALPYFFYKVTSVSENHSLNIAYWNLHERNLTEENGVYKVNNEPALLFHFSGFSTPSQGKLTKHTKRKFSEETEKALFKLIIEYENLILHEKARFKDIKNDFEFCKDPLHKRMARAESIWGIKYLSIGSSRGFFERAGRKIDRLILKKGL